MRLIAVLFLALSTPLVYGAGDLLERYALFTGSNLGGKGTAVLKYASGDAKRFQDVLTRFGGLKEENSLLLVNPEKENLVQGLTFLQSKIKKNRKPDRQIQFVFYYSGHSDEKGLLLNGEHFGYTELKDQIDKLGAEVQIVVLDSCSSGAFTRAKGGQIGAPFLNDLSTTVEGHAFLTSSTAEEVSQESDRIESSFFTHALVEGLRGAADANGDGTVTLNEAYEYAYGQTTADTQATTSGTQHPAFDIKLNGKGNLVMTDLRSGGATLVFPAGMGGKVTVRDIANKLVAEVQKAPDQVLNLGVEEGYYKIAWESGLVLLDFTEVVDEPRAFPVSPDLFRPVEKKVTTRRGPDTTGLIWGVGGFRVLGDGGKDSVSISLLGGNSPQVEGVMAALLYNGTSGSSSGYQGSLFANSNAADFNGFQGTLGANLTVGDFIGVQSGGVFNEVGGRLSGLQFGLVNHVAQTLNLGQWGVVNLLDGDGKYFQMGGWNQAAASFTGLQLGALFNYAQNLTGVQMGLVNYSDEHTGVQIGLVNISHKLTGLPIGLIDIQFNGQNHLDQVFGFTGGSWETLNKDLTSTTVLRFGSEYVYKYFSFQTRLAYSGQNDQLPALGLGVGLGIRIPVLTPGLALHLDGGTTYSRQDYQLDLRADSGVWNKMVPQFRTFASWSLGPNFGVLVGWDHPVLTKNFHPTFSTENKLEIKTDWGNLYMANRFFFGVQL